ncbi:unnamed protein product [Rangifer tarandus platyrhynchus]|uniref:Uncharacterized protein n=1 Tax=Rangifer tarandus platyrhynchus TaxID=3082113 RepID=A0ABN8ZFK3_RANTA|nr:unnamed protein product [Rangifer tarandus platyrhynchus]
MPRSIQQLVQEGKQVAEDWEEGLYLFEFFEFQCMCVWVCVLCLCVCGFTGLEGGEADPWSQMPLKTGGKGGMRQGEEGGERPRCELLFIPLESGQALFTRGCWGLPGSITGFAELRF